MTPLVVDARGLNVSLEGTTILKGIDLAIASGEFVGVVGPSGCGKTTLLNTLASFLPHGGTLVAPDHIGVVFQDHAVFPWMTVRENIGFGLRDRSEDERKRVVAEMLEMIELDTRADYYPAQLSGGQVQRVGIARALAPAPSIVYMDEPFASLDRLTRERMQNWTLGVCERHRTTVVFVTHDVEEALYMSDRVIVLDHGRVIATVPVPFGRPRTDSLKGSHALFDLTRVVLASMSGDPSATGASARADRLVAI